MTLSDKRVLIAGGTSDIGFGAASAGREAGASVTIASRSPDKVEAAVARLGASTFGRRLDITDETAIEKFFAEELPFDHILISAAKTRVAPVRGLPLSDAYQSMNSKFRGAYRIARREDRRWPLAHPGLGLPFGAPEKRRRDPGQDQRLAGRTDARPCPRIRAGARQPSFARPGGNPAL
ncbi:SDR family NAD(P)-dependent oxidoreductase [Sandaracinobacter sp. RS1-74]|uniref:SDR family NAD(P)-dependent oxidoreductase n=1 Tax=Sandaracinobacteroides sayramensis TaxID=2913411 RepID=UPI001EDB0391|nr:SDR family NAD(P)-dependent oxidoreductase [Sandaracinobacteroides sayramensis]MCG2842588.1 SDR family NAD(P)-dependent oxidoreductase [Sandaracinobacteroides sayramensis]